MQIQRPDCIRTPRLGSVSIPLSPLLDLAPVLAAVRWGGDQDLPAGGHEEVAVIITESDQILRTLRCGSAADSASWRWL
jgi:hypothetical protein